MSKHVLVFAAIASALLLFSCQKEIVDPGKDDPKKPDDPENPVFSASIEEPADSKTTITYYKDGQTDRAKVYWVSGDKITIDGIEYTAEPKGSGDEAKKADFTKTGEGTPTAPYHAFYPSDIQTGAGATGTLPSETTLDITSGYDAKKISNIPMYATSSTTQLKFKNICSVLKVTVKNADFPSVKSIRVSSSNCATSGAFTISSDGTTAVLDNPSDVSKTCTLTFSGAVSTDATNGTVFHIAIPAQTYQNLKIELSSDGTSYSKSMTTKKDQNIPTVVNTIYPITFSADKSPVLLPGEFSVSATKTVKFTNGNLYWDGSAYKLEESQTAYPTTWNPSHVGHFYWTKTADASYAQTYSDGTCTIDDKLFCDGSDAAHSLTVDGQSGLYALSSAEWTYLINTRTNASNLYKNNVTVNNVSPCLVIAPDGFDTSKWKTGTTITYTLAEIEAAGLVCLPPAGYRFGTDLDNQGNSGCYWSSTPYGDDKNGAYSLSFNDSGVTPGSRDDRESGNAIRLVKTASIIPPATNLSAGGTANCYIVSKADTYKFKTVKGNSSESVGTVQSAEVLWESYGTDESITAGNLIKADVSVYGDYIFFTTGSQFPTKKGNAVIAAKDASGNILWSWHIWLADKPNDQVYNNNAGTMMDRNLGATSATPGAVGAIGLLYQWGRKDPFLGSSSISSNVAAASTKTWPNAEPTSSHLEDNTALSYSIANPTTYIYNSTSPYDWYCTSSGNRNDGLWGSPKTIYDPCPPGYRVPDGNVWSIALNKTIQYYSSNWNDEKCGMNFGRSEIKLYGTGSDDCWYSGHGIRKNDNGLLDSVGSSGSYWSCTPSEGTNAGKTKYFNILKSSGMVRPSQNYSRAGGLSVRCLSE